MIEAEKNKPQYDNLLGEMIDGMSACFGNEACQEQREIDLERQRMEMELVDAQAGQLGTVESTSTGMLVTVAFGVLVFLGLIVWYVVKKRRG